MQATIRKSNKVRRSKGDVIFDTVVYIITGLMILIAIYPMYFILIASISDPALVSSGEIVLIPNGFNLRAYEKLAEFDDIWTGYRNTILYVIGGTAITLAVNIPASFALSRKQLFGKRVLMAMYLIPMFFTGGLIPTYMVVKAVNLVDNPLVMILPFSVASYYIIVGRTFFQNTIPEELWEAAGQILLHRGASAFQSRSGRDRPVVGRWTMERVFQRVNLSTQPRIPTHPDCATQHPD